MCVWGCKRCCEYMSYACSSSCVIRMPSCVRSSHTLLWLPTLIKTPLKATFRHAVADGIQPTDSEQTRVLRVYGSLNEKSHVNEQRSDIKVIY